LLADEPTAGLDPERAASVLDLLERLSDERGLTLLLVTHDPGILDRFERRLDVGRLSAREPSEPVP
ncbi:MAG: AAA family ATPase, partial [Holophagales bacterium]|nr:AAA family ATPase [Holophagales bacterium]